MIRLAIPNKGRLRPPTLRLLARIGLHAPSDGEHDRGLTVATADRRYQLLSVNARDVATFVDRGAADVGITGTDLLEESGRPLAVAVSLGFGRSRLVLAVPETSEVRRAEDLAPGTRVATSLPRLARVYFEALARSVEVVPLSGAVEAAPAIGIADAILDLVETGATLRSNGLREVATVREVEAAAVARPGLAGTDRGRVEELLLALRSVVRAERSRYLMANVPAALLPELSSLLPGVGGPTVLPLLGRDDWVAIHAVVDAAAVNGIVAVLTDRGATGILVTPLERLVAA